MHRSRTPPRVCSTGTRSAAPSVGCPADQRAVIVLHFYLDLPLADTAASLGIPVGTAKSRINRAVSAMRAAVEADARPGGRAVARGWRMTPFDRSDRLPAFEQALRDALTDDAGTARTDYLTDILVQTVASRQRPAWTFISRWIPMSVITSRAVAPPRIPVRILVAVALIALVIAGAASSSLALARTCRRRSERPRTG